MVGRVLPDVAGIDRAFDYAIPADLATEVTVGTRVRVELHGRRVGGWVVELPTAPGTEQALRPIAKVTGRGPAPDVVELARWAAWRWAGRLSAFLSAASPLTAVRGLPGRGRGPISAGRAENDALATEAFGRAAASGDGTPVVLRWPPAADPIALVLEAARRGDALILVPSLTQVAALAGRLRQSGVEVAVVPRQWALAAAGGRVALGTRSAAWAPRPRLEAVLVLDEHDEVYQEERAPTWNARDVAVERARRAGCPCVVASPCPSLDSLARGPLLTPSRADERAGWPILEVVDRRAEPPGLGLFSPRLVDVARRSPRVVCVLNRKGRARILACAVCGALARCTRCQAAVEQSAERELQCRRCQEQRPLMCAECGAGRLKALRVGVSAGREELERLVRRPVAEVTGEGRVAGEPDAEVLIGTEAALHRSQGADVVAFLDFDQELLAPRYRAAEQAIALLALAARLVGPRSGGGRLLVQTRLPRHETLDAVLHADPGRLALVEGARRAALRFPPETALALVSGDGAEEFVAALRGPTGGGCEVMGPAGGRWLVRAPDHEVLGDALASTPRPRPRTRSRLRVEVDPLRA